MRLIVDLALVRAVHVLDQGILTRERLSTVNLLIKVAFFVKNVKIF
jgi:hypothetical protein